jgi:phage host-nuclease inhibitor protein Gam
MKDYLKLADEQLAAIARQVAAIRQTEAEASAEIEKIRSACQSEMDAMKADLSVLEKDLLRLAKTVKGAIFNGESDRVDLPHGSLLYQVEKRVRKARSVTTDRLEELGFDDAVKTAKSVDWDAIDQWPDARLAAIGTERKRKEVYSYELKNAGN